MCVILDFERGEGDDAVGVWIGCGDVEGERGRFVRGGGGALTGMGASGLGGVGLVMICTLLSILVTCVPSGML